MRVVENSTDCHTFTDLQSRIAEILAIDDLQRHALVYRDRVLEDIAEIGQIEMPDRAFGFRLSPPGEKSDIRAEVAKQVLELYTSTEIAAINAAMPKGVKLAEAAALDVNDDRSH
jgi:hypothetical protein